MRTTKGNTFSSFKSFTIFPIPPPAAAGVDAPALDPDRVLPVPENPEEAPPEECLATMEVS